MRTILKYTFLTITFIIKHIAHLIWWFKIKDLTWKKHYEEIKEWYHEDRYDYDAY